MAQLKFSRRRTSACHRLRKTQQTFRMLSLNASLTSNGVSRSSKAQRTITMSKTFFRKITASKTHFFRPTALKTEIHRQPTPTSQFKDSKTVTFQATSFRTQSSRMRKGSVNKIFWTNELRIHLIRPLSTNHKQDILNFAITKPQIIFPLIRQLSIGHPRKNSLFLKSHLKIGFAEYGLVTSYSECQTKGVRTLFWISNSGLCLFLTSPLLLFKKSGKLILEQSTL